MIATQQRSSLSFARLRLRLRLIYLAITMAIAAWVSCRGASAWTLTEVPARWKCPSNSSCRQRPTTSIEATTNDKHDTSRNESSTRRHIFRKTLLQVVAGATLLPTAVTAATDTRSAGTAAAVVSTDTDASCQSGALVAEQAIPGAYQQVCMSLPTRQVPITITVPGTSSATHILLTLEQGGAAAGTTGLAVWNSSLLLQRLLQTLTATAISTDRTWLSNQHVLELGCGTGLVSLTAAAAGAASVTATDGNPVVVELAARNLQTNAKIVSAAIPKNECRLEAVALPWGLLDAVDYTELADLVLGSDLTYNAGSWRVLAETMAMVVKPTGCIVYLSLGHAGFNVNAEMDGFMAVARAQGLVPVQVGDAGWPLPNVSSSCASLEELLLRDCVSAAEREMLQATGGVRVLVLHKQIMGSKR